MNQPLKIRLDNALNKGSKADRKIANFMMSGLSELPFETASSIAKKVEVSEATVGRFCRSLGYTSFKNLKDHLKNDIGDHPWLMSDRLRELQDNEVAGDAAMASGMELEIAGLVSVYELARTPEWRRAVKRLATRDCVHVAGFQTERGIAQYFANQLQYIRDRVTLLDLAGGNFIETLATDQDACLVIFEARRYSRLAKLLAQEARAAGIPVTLVTDIFCDWGHAVADEVFAVRTQFHQFWDSTALMASLSNLLIHGVFTELGPEVDNRLDKIARLYGRFTGHVGAPQAQVEN